MKYRNFSYHFVRGMFKKLARRLTRWHAKLKHWHAFGTLAHLLARWHAGILARKPR